MLKTSKWFKYKLTFRPVDNSMKISIPSLKSCTETSICISTWVQFLWVIIGVDKGEVTKLIEKTPEKVQKFTYKIMENKWRNSFELSGIVGSLWPYKPQTKN